MFDHMRQAGRLMLCGALAVLVPSSAAAEPLAYDLAAVAVPAAVAAPAPAPAPQATRDVTATLSNIHVTRELQIAHWLHPGEFAWDAEAAAVSGR
ncbi:MAG TPA: hypothetical protein VLK25_13600, partial [Allosphingosinicella sp.]|nr:hypothetical protein [Allosphingosinicella sp.]